MSKRRQSGMGVIESLIYIAIAVLFVLLIVDAIVTMSQSYRKLVVARTLANSGVVAMDRLIREMRTADGVDLTQSVLDATSGSVRLFTTDANGVAGTVSFKLENGIVNLYVNDVLDGPLTSSNASTTALIFHLNSNANAKQLGVVMTLQSTRGSDTRTATYQTTIELRNSL